MRCYITAHGVTHTITKSRGWGKYPHYTIEAANGDSVTVSRYYSTEAGRNGYAELGNPSNWQPTLAAWAEWLQVWANE